MAPKHYSYRIGSQNEMEATPVTKTPNWKAQPRSLRALSGVCAGFSRERAFLLRTGFMECLFRPKQSGAAVEIIEVAPQVESVDSSNLEGSTAIAEPVCDELTDRLTSP